MESQNILFITRTMGLGGTENVILQLCEILANRVNKIVVCSSGGVHEKKLKEMGVRHYKITDISSKNPVTFFRNSIVIKTILKKEHITVIHAHHRMAAFYTEILAPKGVVKIANAHGTFQDKKKLTQLAYKGTKIIAVGEMVKKNLTEYFKIAEEQICVIHNAVKPFEGDMVPVEKLQLEHRKGRILIGNIGRMSEEKGMQFFIEAAELTAKVHPEAVFVIVGDGEQREQLFQMVETKKMQDRVCFLGYRNDVQNVMSQLDFIVLSSLLEGFPLTPMEAYSVGKTVIGTAVGGTTEIIRDGIDGCLVEPRNSERLADRMNWMIENPGIRQKMEIQAKKRYQDEFSFENLIQRYIDFYENL